MRSPGKSLSAGSENLLTAQFQMRPDQLRGAVAVSTDHRFGNRHVFFVTGVDAFRVELEDSRDDALHPIAELAHDAPDFLIAEELCEEQMKLGVERHSLPNVVLAEDRFLVAKVGPQPFDLKIG